MNTTREKTVTQTIIIIAILFATIALIIILMFLKDAGVFNSSKHDGLEKLITVKYPAKTFNEIENSLSFVTPTATIDDIRKKVNIECLRKIGNEGYAILMQDDNKKVILYFNKYGYFVNMVRIDKLLRKKDFSFIKVGKTTKNDVRKVDRNYIYSEIDTSYVSWHVLADGYMIIDYDVVNNESVVKKINFYSGDEYNTKREELKNINNEDLKDLKNFKLRNPVTYFPPLLDEDKKLLSN